MSGGDDESDRVGYKRPPKKHQFAKGVSGNPRGRKPKRERALLPREVRRDILKVGEMLVSVNTPDGVTRVSGHEAVLISLFKKAVAGHILSQRLFLEKYDRAVAEHYEIHKEFADLEMLERHIIINEPDGPEMHKWLNKLRKATRRT